ncbi:MAG TPA: galactokinase [Solirubrobacteraceae bacterium]|nr:galactokinase [Solirubrobacteraceae bacterium]
MSREVSAFGPGRVNLIGEHTDYNDGLALPFAIGEGVCARATPLPGRRIEAVAADLDEHDSFAIDSHERADGWRAYVRGAVAELQAAGVELTGTRVEITGTVPQGSGLSSSAALEVAVALALMAAADAKPMDRLKLARLCSRVENEWVGAQTGLLDQLGSLFGERDQALRIDFRTLEVSPVPLELGGYRLVTLDSGEQHANAGSGYNERRRECAQACERLGIESLRDATLEQAEGLPDPLDRRVRHVLTSNARVEAAVAALAEHDLEQLGQLLDDEHASLRDDYEVSTQAVEAAVKRLKDTGALGARVVGGGFGGSVLGLLPPDAGPPEDAVEVRPGEGARVLR